MAKNIKTWKNGTLTETSPRERKVWVAYSHMDGIIRVGQADIYYGVKGWSNVYVVGGVMLVDESVRGEYKTRQEAEARADEIAADGYCGVPYTRS